MYSDKVKFWGLDQATTFLNHGSFGASPLLILEKQTELRREMEAQAVKYFIRDLEPRWDEARMKTAKFLGSKTENLVFVKNTTMGVNTIFRSIQLGKGDEVVITSHEYGACVNAIKHYAQLKGFGVKMASVPFPIGKDDEVVSAVLKEITSKTKLVFIDHITSSTGMIFPVEKVIAECKEKNILVFIDGAHAPGMLDLKLDALGADYYVGNCHKWICSPKGSAIMYVSPEKQNEIQPLQISHNYDKSNEWSKQFFWPGTDDYSAYLCVPDSIEFMGKLFSGGWKELRNHNRDLILAGRKLVADACGTLLLCPDNMIGAMADILVGPASVPKSGFNHITELQETLFSKYRIELPVFLFPWNEPNAYIRISAQAYNHISQYEYLAEALREIYKQ